MYNWSKSFSLCIILSSHLCTVGVKASPSVLFSPLTFVQLEWKLLPLYYSLLSPLYSWSESFSHCIILSSHLCTVVVKASPSVLLSPLTFVQLEWKSFSLCIILSSHLCTVGVKASPSVLLSPLTFVQLERKLLPLYYSLLTPLYSWSESFSLCIILSSHFVQLEWKLLPLYYSLFSPLYSWSESLLPLFYSLLSPLYSWSESFSHCIILSSHLCTVGVKASPSVLFSLLIFVQLEWTLLPLYYSLFSPLYSCSESFSHCIIISSHLLYSWSESFSLCIILSSHLCTVGVKASPSVLFSPLTFAQLE